MRSLPDQPRGLIVDVDPDIVRELLPLARRRAGRDFSIVRPRWASDIRWFGPRTKAGFDRFEDAFRRLGIAGHVAPLLDLDREVRLYSGFLVMRRHCSKPDFHVDWRGTNGQACTLITPVTGNAEGFGLLYRDEGGAVRNYDYRLGEAVLFSDEFLHSTRPGKSEADVVLLSFTFGTDQMKYWDRIRATSGSQSTLMCRPDGQFETISRWQSWRRHLGWLAYRAGLRRNA